VAEHPTGTQEPKGPPNEDQIFDQFARVMESDSRRRGRTPIRVAIVGVGNCASSLVQGIQHYSEKSAEDAVGLMHWEIGGYRLKSW
jgi:hypothetical protein